MEFPGVGSLPGWCVGLLTFVLAVCLYTRYKQSYFQRLGIPTKTPTFLLGDIADAIRDGISYLDISVYEKYGKVFGAYNGNQPMLVISDPEILKQITVKEFSKFTNRSATVPIRPCWYSALSMARGDAWRFLRHTISPTFTAAKMRNMVPCIQQSLTVFHNILETKRLEHPDGFDLDPYIHSFTMEVICNAGYGLDTNAQRNPDNPFVENAREFLGAFAGSNPLIVLVLLFPDISKWFPSLLALDFVPRKNFEFFRHAIVQALDDRQEARKSCPKSKDLLQMIANDNKCDKGSRNLENEESKRSLTEEEVLVNSVFFMLAGYDTTASVIGWTVYDLVTNTDIQEKLIEEIHKEIGKETPTYNNVFALRYMDMVLKETLRMHPPANRINREASEDVVINGLKIPKGMDCTYSARILHFLPEYWEEPNKYNPDRFAPDNSDKINEYAYIPFGVGPRHCVGMRLALLEVKMIIVSLLQKYRIHKTATLTIPMPSSKAGFYKVAKRPITLGHVLTTSSLRPGKMAGRSSNV